MLEIFNSAGAELLKRDIEAVAVGTAKPKMQSRVPKTAGNDTVDLAEAIDRGEATAVIPKIQVDRHGRAKLPK